MSAVERYGAIVRRHSVARTTMMLADSAITDLQTKDSDEVVDGLLADLRCIDAHVPTGTPDGFMKFEELVAKPESARSPWVIPGLLRRDWRSMFVGPEGSGKTIFLRQIAFFAASGIHPFMGQERPINPVRTFACRPREPGGSPARLDRQTRPSGRDLGASNGGPWRRVAPTRWGRPPQSLGSQAV